MAKRELPRVAMTDMFAETFKRYMDQRQQGNPDISIAHVVREALTGVMAAAGFTVPGEEVHPKIGGDRSKQEGSDI